MTVGAPDDAGRPRADGPRKTPTGRQPPPPPRAGSAPAPRGAEPPSTRPQLPLARQGERQYSLFMAYHSSSEMWKFSNPHDTPPPSLRHPLSAIALSPAPDGTAGLERRSLTGTRPGGPQRRTAPGPDGAGKGRRASVHAASPRSPASGGRCRSETGAPSRPRHPSRLHLHSNWPALQAVPVVGRGLHFSKVLPRFQTGERGHQPRPGISDKACSDSSRSPIGNCEESSQRPFAL